MSLAANFTIYNYFNQFPLDIQKIIILMINGWPDYISY